jgi:L-aspartate oxidase
LHTDLSTEFLVIGGGIAGLRAAIALADAGRVLVITKAEATESNTGYAQGGIAAALGADDSPALHAKDTIRAGAGLCDEAAVRVLVEEGPTYVTELVDWGVRFERDESGQLAFGREAAHSVRRVLHAGDATGREIGRVLWERVSRLPRIAVINYGVVTELAVEDGVAAGAWYVDRDGVRRRIAAKATLLATGGAGQVFRETTNPAVATGDGIALGYFAGARVADLEFVQFHPTALKLPGAPRFLISEALRGEGARLVNAQGEPFMVRYHEGGDLAPRDVVARAIVQETERTPGPVSLRLDHLDPVFVRRRFPNIAEMCRRVGLNLATDLIPVGPAAHYMMGGVDTDRWGRTSVPGLFAAGEVACTGVHGANRLASNSLLEGLVFGARAGYAMQEGPAAAPEGPGRRPSTGPPAGDRVGPDVNHDAVRELVWTAAGLFRTRDGLTGAVSTLDAASAAVRASVLEGGASADWQHLNFLTVAQLIARAALRREESRGGHFRVDFPARDDDHWRVHLTEVA